MMDFATVLKKRRSVRKFTKKDVSNEIVMKIIEDASYAPSSGNEQPWKFIVVNNKSLMKRISDDAKKSLLMRIDENPDDYAKKYEHILRNESFDIFYDAPAVVFIIGDASLKNTVVNCTLAAGNFMLSAVTYGLGTCWINFATALRSKVLLGELGVENEYKIVAPIIIGYPDILPAMPERKRVDVVTIE